MVDTLVLGTSIARFEGSSPSRSTKINLRISNKFRMFAKNKI